jgi:hypothetical protein
VDGCDDRVVDIMSVEDGLSPVAPAQQAVLRVYQCIADGDQSLGANGAGHSGRVSARYSRAVEYTNIWLYEYTKHESTKHEYTKHEMRIYPLNIRNTSISVEYTGCPSDNTTSRK